MLTAPVKSRGIGSIQIAANVSAEYKRYSNLVKKSVKPFGLESSEVLAHRLESAAPKSAGQAQRAGAPKRPPFPQVKCGTLLQGMRGVRGLGEGGLAGAEGTRHFLGPRVTSLRMTEESGRAECVEWLRAFGMPEI